MTNRKFKLGDTVKVSILERVSWKDYDYIEYNGVIYKDFTALDPTREMYLLECDTVPPTSKKCYHTCDAAADIERV